jgi:hypothetical protein
LKYHHIATFGDMNNTELMLENLIVYRDQVREVISISEEQLTLRSIDEPSNSADNVNVEQCLGIPLNEDWLQALELIEDKDNSPDYGVWYYFPDERLTIKLAIRGTHRVEFENGPLRKISFVHQLQNLNLLITGEALHAKTYPDLWNLYLNGLGATSLSKW